MKKSTNLTSDQKENILTDLAERIQELLDNAGGSIVKVFTDSLTYEGEFLESVSCEGVELEVYFDNGSHFEFVVDDLESTEDVETHNPILRFKGGLALEFDMWED